MPIQVCPSCGSEHRATAEWCSDCDVALEPTGGSPPQALPPTDELSPVLRDSPWELERTVAVLQEAGIACRVDRYPPPDQGEATDLALYVRDEDREPAETAIQEYRAGALPDATDFPRAGEVLDSCPACGAALAAAATSCTECELEFPAASYACRSCGAEFTADQDRCPDCGAAQPQEVGP